ncbi:MAG: AmmeMemoRadiSam system radical SAM enzyme [Promethearchaeota archaeon]
MSLPSTTRPAFAFKPLSNDNVRCDVCHRHCMLDSGEIGFCNTRQNIDGSLYTLVYGDIQALSVNPIEKKPLFHYFPSSFATTVGTNGCNFTCPYCQNWYLSKRSPTDRNQQYISPTDLLEFSLQRQVKGISISFNEPTMLLEYALDVFKLAYAHDLYSMFVTNGYMTKEALLALINAGMSGMTVTLKGSKSAVKKYCQANVDHVWENLRIAVNKNVWCEVVTLVVPTINDDENSLHDIAQHVRNELGEDVPLHFTRYHPDYQFNQPATPIKTLERARQIGLEEGLQFVYLGNVPGHPFEDTYCPSCGKRLIHRSIFEVLEYQLTETNECPKCHELIPIRN